MSIQKQAIVLAFFAFISLTVANECTSPLQGPGCHTLGSGLQSIIDAFTDFSAELENIVVDTLIESQPT